jgi:hypothetical protein
MIYNKKFGTKLKQMYWRFGSCSSVNHVQDFQPKRWDFSKLYKK